METKIENLTIKTEGDQMTISQSFKTQGAVLVLLLGGAAAIILILTFLFGDPVVGLFFGGALAATAWFIKKHSSERYVATLDRAAGTLVTVHSSGKPDVRFEAPLTDFKKLVIVWTREFLESASTYERFLLTLYRPLDDDDIKAEVPDHLSKAMDQSPLAQKLITATARMAAIDHAQLVLQPLRHQESVETLAQLVRDFLGDAYPLRDDVQNLPKMFSVVH